MLSDSETLERSPYLVKLQRGRLAPSRLRDLYSAAQSSSSPKEPDPWECCASSCKPCVRELWKQEVRCWKECHPDGEEEEEAHDEAGELVELEPLDKARTDPGAKSSDGPTLEIRIGLDSLSIGLKGDGGEEGTDGTDVVAS